MLGLHCFTARKAFQLAQRGVNGALTFPVPWRPTQATRPACMSASNVPLFHAAYSYGDRCSITDSSGSHSYTELLQWAKSVADTVRPLVECSPEQASHVAVMCRNSASYVACQWGLWSLGSSMAPLSPQHPPAHLEYFLVNSAAKVVVADDDHYSRLRPLTEKLNCHLLLLPPKPQQCQVGDGVPDKGLSSLDWNSRTAVLFYTSGTTGPPKGVPLTHGNLRANVNAMSSAWKISKDDTVLHCLPLHHVHGVINALTVPLAVGGRVHMLPHFNAEAVWQQLLGCPVDDVSLSSDRPQDAPTIFMAVPTMYAKLLQFVDQLALSPTQLNAVRENCKRLRLMISGSAPLPDPILTRWEKLTGQRLLERYGMTEIGMALTNPLEGDRIAGAVGHPFPGVSIRIVSDNNKVVAEGTSESTVVMSGQEGQQGELQVKGPNVFSGYWNNPEATRKSFTDDGWFLTGDTAVYDVNTYRLVGRSSVDIIKSGGYKISALDVERCLLAHPLIEDCAVVGVADDVWGQKVAAVAVFRRGEEAPTLDDIRSFAKETLPPYSLPSLMEALEQIPRNAMGKVDKKQLVQTVFVACNAAK